MISLPVPGQKYLNVILKKDPEFKGFVKTIAIFFSKSEWELENNRSPCGPDLCSDVIRCCQCATQKRGNNTHSVQCDDGGVFHLERFLLVSHNPIVF